MVYTLGTAAKATGKSKTTIQRAVAKGLISAEKSPDGSYAIDPSELHRVFPPQFKDETRETPKVDDTRPLVSTEETLLNIKIEALEEMLLREREALEDLRADRDAWKQQATALLLAPDQVNSPPHVFKKNKWWPW